MKARTRMKRKKSLVGWICKLFKKEQPKKENCSYDPYEGEEMTAQDFESDIFHEECGDR